MLFDTSAAEFVIAIELIDGTVHVDTTKAPAKRIARLFGGQDSIGVMPKKLLKVQEIKTSNTLANVMRKYSRQLALV